MATVVSTSTVTDATSTGNLFFKDMDKKMDPKSIFDLFSPFGKIVSCKVALDKEGNCKGYGFVSFENEEAAQQFIEKMHATLVERSGKKVIICSAKKMIEAHDEHTKRDDEHKGANNQQYPGVNLYVKNFDRTVDDEALKKLFENFGNITSVKVMTDENGRSKGFGFVCFENAEDAYKAISTMNCRISGRRPLYVAVAQRKEDRDMHKASKYMQSMAYMRMHNPKISGNTTHAPVTYAPFAAAQVQPGFMAQVGVGFGGMPMVQGGWGGQVQQGSQAAMIQKEGHVYPRRGQFVAKNSRSQMFAK